MVKKIAKKKVQKAEQPVGDTATVNRAILSRALNTTNKAVDNNPVNPLLANVLVEVNNGQSRIAATNLEIGISISFEAVAGKPFAACLPAKTFQGLVDTISVGDIEMQLDESNQSVTVTAENSASSLKYVSAVDFPDIPQITEANISIPVIQFKNMINRVAFACKAEGEGSPLEGVLLSWEASSDIKESMGKFIMFAADSVRLSYEETDMVSMVSTGIHALIKGSTLELIARMLPDEGEVEIQQVLNKVLFHCGAVNVVSQILEGRLPDYRLVIKSVEERTTTLTVRTLDLIRACKQLKLFAIDTGMSKMTISDMLVKYSTARQERGDSDAILFAEKEGEDIEEIGLNVFYLQEVLEVISTEQTVFKFNGTKIPVTIFMDGIDSFIHIIMPFNIK